MPVKLSDDLRKKLGIVKNVPKVDWYKYSGVIATPPKFGKTTLASLIPNSILIACESGYDSLELDYTRIKTWKEFIELIDVLEENAEEIGDEVKLAIIDTIHEMWGMCTQSVLNDINRKLVAKGKTKVETVNQYNYQAGLKIRNDEWKKQFNRLEAIGIKPLFLGHLVMKKIKPEDEESFNSLELDFDTDLYNLVIKDVSYILIGQNIKEKDEDGSLKVNRKFISKNDGIIQGGSRVHFGEDIYFETEAEFLDKFQKIFEDTILQKNNINVKDKAKLLKEEDKEVLEKRKEVKKETSSKETLLVEIKTAMEESAIEKRKEVLSYMMEEFGEKTPASLKNRTVEELKEILTKLK